MPRTTHACRDAHMHVLLIPAPERREGLVRGRFAMHPHACVFPSYCSHCPANQHDEHDARATRARGFAKTCVTYTSALSRTLVWYVADLESLAVLLARGVSG